MRAHNLLKTADDLLSASAGKPRQTNLLRASSTVYYALFHALARCCADVLIGTSSAQRSRSAWSQVYRALEHGETKKRCIHKTIQHFPHEIQDFANRFVTMQSKRHDADYNPDIRLTKSAVQADLISVKDTITKFNAAPIKDRRAFAAYVLLRARA